MLPHTLPESGRIPCADAQSSIKKHDYYTTAAAVNATTANACTGAKCIQHYNILLNLHRRFDLVNKSSGEVASFKVCHTILMEQHIRYAYCLTRSAYCLIH